MAKLIFSLEELAEILTSNELLPSAVSKLQADGDKITFVVKIESFFIPAIPASLRFLNYQEGCAVFEFTLVNSSFNKAIGGLSRMFESKIPPFIRLDLPNVHVDVEKMLEQRNIKGVHIKNVILENSEFTIETVHS